MKTRSKVLRTSAAVLLGLGVVAGGLQVGPGDEPVAVAAGPAQRYYLEGEMPEYPGSAEFPLGDGLAVNGLPVRVSHFSTNDRAEKVLDFYLQSFKDMGLEPRDNKLEDGTLNISALAADGVNQHVVVIVPKTKGADVFPSIVPLDADLETNLPDADLPLSPTAVGVMRVEAKGEGPGGTVTYQEPTLMPQEAAQHIKQTMLGRGWQLKEFRTVDRSSLVEVVRGKSSAHFTITGYKHAPKGVAVFARYAGRED